MIVYHNLRQVVSHHQSLWFAAPSLAKCRVLQVSPCAFCIFVASQFDLYFAFIIITPNLNQKLKKICWYQTRICIKLNKFKFKIVYCFLFTQFLVITSHIQITHTLWSYTKISKDQHITYTYFFFFFWGGGTSRLRMNKLNSLDINILEPQYFMTCLRHANYINLRQNVRNNVGKGNYVSTNSNESMRCIKLRCYMYVVILSHIYRILRPLPIIHIALFRCLSRDNIFPELVHPHLRLKAYQWWSAVPLLE